MVPSKKAMMSVSDVTVIEAPAWASALAIRSGTGMSTPSVLGGKSARPDMSTKVSSTPMPSSTKGSTETTRLFVTKSEARPKLMPMAMPLEASPAPMSARREPSMALGEKATRQA